MFLHALPSPALVPRRTSIVASGRQSGYVAGCGGVMVVAQREARREVGAVGYEKGYGKD